MTRQEIIQGAIYAALGCTKIDFQSPKKIDEAANQIARFVIAELEKSDFAIVWQGSASAQGTMAVTKSDNQGH